MRVIIIFTLSVQLEGAVVVGVSTEPTPRLQTVAFLHPSLNPELVQIVALRWSQLLVGPLFILLSHSRASSTEPFILPVNQALSEIFNIR